MIQMTANGSNQYQIRPAEPGRNDLRVVMLAQAQTLADYGPELKRVTVGLLDEVADLTLMCLGDSRLLDYLPCPPLRIVREIPSFQDTVSRFNPAGRQVVLTRPYYPFLDRFWPSRHYRRLADALAAYKPRLIHALSEREVTIARRVSKLLNIPYAASLLKADPGWLDVSPRRCTALLPCESKTARELRQRWDIVSERVHLSPVGTHVPENASSFSHGTQRPHILCSSPLEVGYGLPTFINAIRELVDIGLSVFVTITGKGSRQSDLWQQAQDLKLQGILNFIDPLDEIVASGEAFKRVFHTVDIFVQPWPLQEFRPELLEAMSMGTAVVAVKGSSSDMLVEDKTALLVPFRNEKAMAETLKKLVLDHVFAHQLGKQAQLYLRKHFLASRMITRLTNAYRQSLRMQ